MRQETIEMLAFFYLCGEKDRSILLKKEKMLFRDFLRFDYLTKRIGLWEYNKKIWEEFSEEFKQQIIAWAEDAAGTVDICEEIGSQEEWWENLLKNNEDLLDLESKYCQYQDREKVVEIVVKYNLFRL